LALVPIEADVAAALAQVPAVAGVGQVLGPEGQNLLVGRGADLRRWFASQLGRGRPPKKGQRPALDLSPIATALAFTPTTSEFHQRLVYERLMARYVPLSARRDLKTPAFLRLDPAERFPRASVTTAAADGGAFGPFRDRRAAARAVEALHARFPLRPCDFTFEPAPDLALGLSCLYAQVRSCAAPCLARMGEGEYRGLAAEAAAFLSHAAARPAEAGPAIPAWVSRATARAVVVEGGREGLELYPVSEGQVFEEGAVRAAAGGVDEAMAALRWPEPPARAADWPWLLAWLHTPRRKGEYRLLAAADPR
jgi:hypothetical protein